MRGRFAKVTPKHGFGRDVEGERAKLRTPIYLLPEAPCSAEGPSALHFQTAYEAAFSSFLRVSPWACLRDFTAFVRRSTSAGSALRALLRSW